MNAPHSLSQYPDDRLIRELIATGRDASPEEIAQIIERVATAPFNPDVHPIRVVERGTTYAGETLGPRAKSLTFHLIKRVVIEDQWADGTTAAQYLADVRAAVREPSGRLKKTFHSLLVIYSADRGIIVTGYQFSSFAETSIPEEARWLK